MTVNLKLAKILWATTAVLAFLAALAGVLVEDVYVGLFPEDFLPGATAQDILTMGVALALLGLGVVTRQEQVKRQVVIVGLLGSLFYLYGIFTIERVYNWFYLFYAAIFGLSFWAIVVSLAGFRASEFVHVRLSAPVTRTTAVSSLVIAAVFTLLWTASLIPLMRDHNRIDFLYSIYILDLCFVMPAFVITALMSLRRLAFGLLMVPAVMIVGFFVIFPLGLNELAKPSAGMTPSVGPMLVSFAFALFMLVLAALQLSKLELAPREGGGVQSPGASP